MIEPLLKKLQKYAVWRKKNFSQEKDIVCGKFSDATRFQFRVLSAEKVQIEPMSKFDLEKNADEVDSFFYGQVDYKAAKWFKIFS